MSLKVNKYLRSLKNSKIDNTSVPDSIVVAIYVRQSTILGQNYHSVEEQVDFIKHRIKTKQIVSVLYPKAKLIFKDEFIFSDRGKTGRVGRENYDNFKNCLIMEDAQIGLCFDFTRLRRELGSLLSDYDLAHAHNFELISASEMFSTHSEGARSFFIVKGISGELQSETTSKQTKRGLELRALQGKSTGQFPFGYKSVPENPDRVRQQNEPANRIIKIDEEKSKIVLRIFETYANTDFGIDGIAKILNSENIPSPKNKHWRGKTIYSILNNPKYIGIWIYGKTCVKRDPIKDRLIKVLKPQDQWIKKEHEHLAIISEALWEKTQIKLRQIEKDKETAKNKSESTWGKNRGKSGHLFTGVTKCSECGGNMITVSGRRNGYLGCFNAHRKGTCKNKKSLRLDWFESSMIGLLKEWLDDKDTLKFLCYEYNKQIKNKLTHMPQQIVALQNELDKENVKISNFLDFIADGKSSNAIAGALEKAEKKKYSLEAQIKNIKAREPRALLLTPYAMKESLNQLDEVLNMDVSSANAHIKTLFPEPVELKPIATNKKSRPYYYEAAGRIQLNRLYEYSYPVNGVPKGI